jgi:hypothetical protein
MKSPLLRAGVLGAALVSVLAAAGCQTPPPPPPPTPPAPPPPPPVAPPLALSAAIVQEAAAYQAYVRQATAEVPGFADGPAIQASLRRSEAYEPKSLARDEVAYAAVIALQEPTFVQGVRVFAVDPTQRAQMVQRLETEPGYALALPGAQVAAAMITAKLGSDGEAISRAGYAIKMSAYAIQHQKWSVEWVPDREGRLAQAKALSAAPGTATSEDGQAMMRAALTGQGLNLAPNRSLVPPSVTAAATIGAAGAPVVAVAPSGDSLPAAPPVYSEGLRRGLALAALAALGAAGDTNDAQVEPLLDEGSGQACLNLAKLNLFQCLAVAKPHYEDVFCLGQHALMETGECVSKLAGVTPVNLSPAPEPKPVKPIKAKAKGKGRGHRKTRRTT